jgi:hypothetical protein
MIKEINLGDRSGDRNWRFLFIVEPDWDGDYLAWQKLRGGAGVLKK